MLRNVYIFLVYVWVVLLSHIVLTHVSILSQSTLAVLFLLREFKFSDTVWSRLGCFIALPEGVG